MQKIDVSPSVAMVNACFDSCSEFAINFKGGIRVHAECLVEDGWRLTRYKHATKTSWVLLNSLLRPDNTWHISVDGSEPIATEMARAVAKFHTSDERESDYYTAVMSIYGGKVSSILSVER